MAVPTINWSSPGLTGSTSQQVFIRQRWSDPWVYASEIWAIERVWSLLPAMPTATLEYRYGKVLPHGGSGWVNRGRLDIAGWYVKIVDTCPDGTISWFGFIDEIGDEQGGVSGVGVGGVPTGKQTFVAYSVAQILAHAFITRSRWIDVENAVDRWSEAATTFNANGKGNRQVSNVGGTDYVFDFGHHNSDFGEFWSSRDIIKYLFTYAMPQDKNGNQIITFRLEGETLIPDWDKPVVETEGQSVLAILQQLINPARLLQLSTYVDANNAIVFKVHSLASLPLTLPNSQTHIENQNPVNIYTAGAHDTYVSTQSSLSMQANQVVVKGDRYETVATMKIKPIASFSEGYTIGFTIAQKDAYEDAASLTAGYGSLTTEEKQRLNEIARSREGARDAFRVFTFNTNWGFVVGSGIDLLWEDANHGQYFPHWAEVKFKHQLPFKKTIDYSGNVIANNTHDDEVKPEDYRSPLVLFKRHGETQYLVAEHMSNTTGNPSFAVAVGLDYNNQCFTLDVQGAPQFAIALGEFTMLPVDSAVQTALGDWRYTEAEITFSFTDDRWAEGRYPEDSSLPLTDIVRRRIIYAGPSYRVVRVLSETVVDVETDGTLSKVTDTAFLRDDRDKLESLAQLAASWYAVPRKIMRMVSARPSASIGVGQLLVAINAGTTLADFINTVISEIRLSTPLGEDSPAPPAMFSVVTAMGELDVLAFNPAPPAPPSSQYIAPLTI